jgi:hypothetical protein
MVNRREIVIAGVAAAVSPNLSRAAGSASAGEAAGAGFLYDYVFVEVLPGPGASSQTAFLAHLSDTVPGVRSAGGEAIGYFTPLIGWSSQNFAILLRWKADAPGRDEAVRALGSHTIISRVDRSRLAATVRPGPADLPKTTGIYTHRWFEVKTSDIPEFIDLSNRAWPYFEKEFPALVYGLFRAEASAEDRSPDVTRMLLNTWYESHAVWEASRKPSSEPTAMFARRTQLTLTTRVASLHFTPLTA